MLETSGGGDVLCSWLFFVWFVTPFFLCVCSVVSTCRPPHSTLPTSRNGWMASLRTIQRSLLNWTAYLEVHTGWGKSGHRLYCHSTTALCLHHNSSFTQKNITSPKLCASHSRGCFHLYVLILKQFVLAVHQLPCAIRSTVVVDTAADRKLYSIKDSLQDEGWDCTHECLLFTVFYVTSPCRFEYHAPEWQEVHG
jgi:hypothetical protein